MILGRFLTTNCLKTCFNDTYGHQAGDQVLSLVGATLRGVARAEDIVGRWGGEEFLVILSAASECSVTVAAERFRAAVADLSVQVGSSLQLSVTISIGGTLSTDSAPETAINAADTALYDAKLGGRNMVVFRQISTGSPSPEQATNFAPV